MSIILSLMIALVFGSACKMIEVPPSTTIVVLALIIGGGLAGWND